jgi:hypothetical protein
MGNVHSGVDHLLVLGGRNEMKRACALLSAALLSAALPVLLVSLAGCIRDVQPVEDIYTPFPEPEILGASFFYQRNGLDVTGAEVGMISKNEDGTYRVRVRRRAPSNVPTAVFITGSFEFSEYYKVRATFPEDPTITDKPYRIYACASRGMDGNLDADYPTANDLKGQAVFRNGVAIGTFEMSNEGINVLNPDRWKRPYITVFLYLYFNNVTDPDDYYEFTLDYVGGARGVIPKSKVSRAAVYRAGDMENKFELPKPDADEDDDYILARFNHRYDSGTINTLDTDSLILELKVPDGDVGQEIEFEMRNVGLYQDGESLIGNTIINVATVHAGTEEPEQSGVVTEVKTSSGSYYKVKAKIVEYDDLFGEPGAGLRLLIKRPVTETEPEPGPFTDTKRVTFTLNVPDKYVGE